MRQRERDLETLLRAIGLDGGSGPIVSRRALSAFVKTLPRHADLSAVVGRNGDLLGPMYERAVPIAARRLRGQFFTPPWASRLMSQWILQQEPKHVLDPAVGSGALLLPIVESSTDVRVSGIDRDPSMIQLARANFAVRKLASRATFLTADFLSSSMSLRRPDAVICNPPYGVHHALSPRAKAAIHTQLERRTDQRFNRRVGLPALFLTQSLHVAATDAVMAFITPSGWLDSQSGREVKELLLDSASVEAIVVLPPNYLLFEQATTTTAITFLRKGSRPKHRTTVLRLRDNPLPSTGKVLRALEKDNGLGRSTHLLTAEWRNHGGRRPRSGEAALGEFARVRRGVATGMNSFFVISEDQRKALRLPNRVLRPCLSSPKLFTSAAITEDILLNMSRSAKTWVLDVRRMDADSNEDAVGKYLREGKELGADITYLARHRSPWYRLEHRGECPIVFPYFNRYQPRFLRNYTDAVPLNNWLIIEPFEGVDPDQLFRVLTLPQVIKSVLKHKRVYGAGLWKIEPRELSELELGSYARRLRK